MSGVYVLLDPSTQFVKIGRATNLDDRLANLRTANPRLSLVEWFETNHDSTAESYVHAKLVVHRQEGEFFSVTPDVAQQEVRAILNLLQSRPNKTDVDSVRTIDALTESRAPKEDELKLVKQIVELRARIKTLETEEQILSERLMVDLGSAKGLLGWASFDGSSTTRFENSRFQQEQPELAKDYLKTTYSRTLKIRPGMAQ